MILAREQEIRLLQEQLTAARLERDDAMALAKKVAAERDLAHRQLAAVQAILENDLVEMAEAMRTLTRGR